MLDTVNIHNQTKAFTLLIADKLFFPICFYILMF